MSKPQIIACDGDKFLTAGQAAAQLGVSVRTVQLWFEDGKIKGCTTVGGHRRLRQSEVSRLVALIANDAGGAPAKVAPADKRVRNAAPKLLEALQELVEHAAVIELDGGQFAVKKARAAIAKATGEKS